MDEKKTKPYEFPSTEPSIAKEPLFMWVTLDIDETKRYTYANYLTWLDGRRRELYNGFIHSMLVPVNMYARISIELNTLIRTYIKKKSKGECQLLHASFDVRLPKNNETADDQIYDVVHPDICVICDLSKLDDKGCIGAPDLMVEVLSPSSIKHDYKTKFDLYEKFGVREYWIVDPQGKTVHTFLLQANGKYNKGTIYNCAQKAPVQIFEGLVIDLKKLFEEM